MKLQEFRGISPEHGAAWEEQTLARPWRRACRRGSSRHVPMLRSAVTISCKKKWSEICSVVFTSHQIASPPSFLHADRNVCFSEKAQGLVKLQGGLQTNDLIQALCAWWSTPTPRKSDNKGLGFQQGGTGQHVAPHVGSV